MNDYVLKNGGVVVMSYKNNELMLICNTRLKLLPWRLKLWWSSSFFMVKVFPHGTMTIGDLVLKSTYKVNGQWLKLHLTEEGMSVMSNGNKELIVIFNTRLKGF